jgi:hypothetical protein
MSYKNKLTTEKLSVNTKPEVFKKFDWNLDYKEDKLKIACLHGFTSISEMMFILFENDFTPTQIGNYLNMTNSGIRYHLKKMNCQMKPKGGSHSKTNKTGIIGVYKHGENKFVVWIYINAEKKYLGISENLFLAAWERRCAEIKYNYNGDSLAQKYINKYWRTYSTTKNNVVKM